MPIIRYNYKIINKFIGIHIMLWIQNVSYLSEQNLFNINNKFKRIFRDKNLYMGVKKSIYGCKIGCICTTVNFNKNLIELCLLQKNAYIFLDIARTNVIKNKLFIYIYNENIIKSLECGRKYSRNKYSYSSCFIILYIQIITW